MSVSSPVSSSQTHPVYCYGPLCIVLLSTVSLVLHRPLTPPPTPRPEPPNSAVTRVSVPPPTHDETSQEKLPQSPLTLEKYTRCLARELKVDESLAVAVLIQESDARNPMKLGRRGGRGPLQIKPIALEDIGLSRHEHSLPVLVYGGLRYLRAMLDRFDNLSTALAAYNMGPTLLKKRNYRPYRVTQRYVRQVLHRVGQIRSGHVPHYPVLHYRLSEYRRSSDSHEIVPLRACLMS